MRLKKDSNLIGLLLGLTVPVIVYFLQLILIPSFFGFSFSNKSMQLFALVFNLPLFRYFIINLNYEKSARGILFMTFIYGLIWVYINKGSF